MSSSPRGPGRSRLGSPWRLLVGIVLLAACGTTDHAPYALGARGFRIGEGADQLELSLASVGCDGAAHVVANVAPTFENNRATFAHALPSGDVREWYLDGPLGLEQGFTITSPLACATAADLVLEVSTQGTVTPRLANDGAVDFVRAGGAVAYRYTDLHTVDAAGRELPGHMEVANGGVRLVVDARGAAYPIIVDPLVTTFRQELSSSDGMADDRFGVVAISGDTAFVGAPLHTVNGTADQGAAYVFTRSAGGWTQTQELVASDGADSDYFGSSLAISGDTAVVGSVRRAYVFVRSGAVWTLQQELTSHDAVPNDRFGEAVSIDGDTVVVGADFHVGPTGQSGAAYVFVRNGTTWTEQRELVAADGDFGCTVSVSGATALIGAFNKVVGSNVQGAAYVFVRSGTTWTQQQELVAPDGTANAYFGATLSLSGDTALIGSEGAGAYVFARSGATWSLQQKLDASDPNFGNLGFSTSLLGDTALVSSEPSIGDTGAAYVFTRVGTIWTEQRELIPSDAVAGDCFGCATGLSSNAMIVGSLYRKVGSHSGQGAAYVYTLPAANGASCFSAGDCTSGNCVDGVCCDTACGGGSAADCQACSVAKGAAVDGTCSVVQASAAVVCRAAAGVCDVAEMCTGASAACPADTFKSEVVVCRAAAGGCDAAETCTRASTACPPDAPRANGATCDDGDPCTSNDACHAGSCAGAAKLCAPADDCHEGGTCDAPSGACSVVPKVDGASCSVGVCASGVCTPQGTTASSASATSSASTSTSGGGESSGSSSASTSASSSTSTGPAGGTTSTTTATGGATSASSGTPTGSAGGTTTTVGATTTTTTTGGTTTASAGTGATTGAGGATASNAGGAGGAAGNANASGAGSPGNIDEPGSDEPSCGCTTVGGDGRDLPAAAWLGVGFVALAVTRRRATAASRARAA